MAKAKKNPRARILGAMLGSLPLPNGLHPAIAEFNQFYVTQLHAWLKTAIKADVMAVVHEDGPLGHTWTGVGQRGTIYEITTDKIKRAKIKNAGTGPENFGYLSTISRIGDRLFVCGYSRQVQERTSEGWVRRDHGLRLDESDFRGLCDIAGNGRGELCAVGFKGEIAFDAGQGDGWVMLDSPTGDILEGVCLDDQGRYWAVGNHGAVIRGGASGFELVCQDEKERGLWDAVWHDGELVVAASGGLRVVRDGALVPFDRPPPPFRDTHKLATSDGVLWSLGSQEIFHLHEGRWTEWVLPSVDA